MSSLLPYLLLQDTQAPNGQLDVVKPVKLSQDMTPDEIAKYFGPNATCAELDDRDLCVVAVCTLRFFSHTYLLLFFSFGLVVKKV